MRRQKNSGINKARKDGRRGKDEGKSNEDLGNKVPLIRVLRTKRFVLSLQKPKGSKKGCGRIIFGSSSFIGSQTEGCLTPKKRNIKITQEPPKFESWRFNLTIHPHSHIPHLSTLMQMHLHMYICSHTSTNLEM